MQVEVDHRYSDRMRIVPGLHLQNEKMNGTQLKVKRAQSRANRTICFKYIVLFDRLDLW